MASQHYAPPKSSLEMPDPSALRRVSAAAWCLVGLLAYLAVAVLAQVVIGVQLPRVLFFLGLLVGIHLAAWRFVVAHYRLPTHSDLKRLALACFVVFWFVDSGIWVLIGQLRQPTFSASALAVSIAGALIDLNAVLAIVFWTVPWASRMYAPRIVP